MKEHLAVIRFFIEMRQYGGFVWMQEEMLKLSVPEQLQNQQTKDFVNLNVNTISSVLKDNQIYSKEEFYSKAILKTNLVGPYPMSSAQQRIWFIEQYEEGTSAYHIPTLYRLDQRVTFKCVIAAIQALVSRHEPLRSLLTADDNGVGVQIVANNPLIIEECQVARSQFDVLLQADIEMPFELDAEYPLRAKLYRLTGGEPDCPEERFLLLNIHHIASDGWSMNVIERELFLLIEAQLNHGGKSNLSNLEIQYKDYALFQYAYLNDNVLNEHLSYWRTRLSGFQELNLPLDYPRPSRIDYAGSIIEFSVDPKLTTHLRKLASDWNTTLHNLMLCAFGILLGKYSGQGDIVIGSPVANRQYSQTEGLVGVFINTLVNRIILEDNESFETLVRRCHLDQIDGQMYQDLPFEKLVDELSYSRDTSRHPIFQVMFGVQGYSNTFSKGDQPWLHQVTPNNVVVGSSKFDVAVFIDDSYDELKGYVKYATTLFKRESINHLAIYYCRLLSELASEPSKIYHILGVTQDVNLDFDSESISNFNFPIDYTLHRLFEEQSIRNPHDTAFIFEENRLTYEQANIKANQLARSIRSTYEAREGMQMPSGYPVVLYLDRSLELVVAMLAVLKSGGAYVPVDPAYPAERVKHILEDTKSALLLCQRHSQGELNASISLENPVIVDLSEGLYLPGDDGDLDDYSSAGDVAYIIYTSGTTGKPKGTMIEHRSAVHYLHCFRQLLPPGHLNMCSVLNYCFDASFPTLMLGAIAHTTTYVSRPEDIAGSSFRLFLEQNCIDVIRLTPSMLDLASIDSIQRPLSIVLGGEKLHLQSINRMLENRNLKIFNQYGPTECTVGVTVCELNRPVLRQNIGRNYPGKKIYVLGPGGMPVPIGMVGELYIGGVGVARGYLNQETLTAERFIDNPFCNPAKTPAYARRLYRTGDFVRMLSDGTLEFIGRKDAQVKIRGHRVELGEIESAIAEVPGIERCRVLQCNAGSNEMSTSLAAYYILQPSTHEISEIKLRNAILQKLPEFMVPEFWIKMDFFPLTQNGKTDLDKFPKPTKLSETGAIVKPRTRIERAACEIWKNILGNDSIGITDDFFSVGGNSIFAIRVAKKMQELLGERIKVADIFRLKTITRILEGRNVAELVVPYADIKKDFPNLILLPAGGSGAEVYQRLADLLQNKFNCIGVDNYNIYNREKIESLSEISAYYLSKCEQKCLIQSPITLLGWSLGGLIALEIASILESRGITAINVILLDTMIRDEKIVNLMDAIDFEPHLERRRKNMEERYGAEYIANVFAAMESEKKIGASRITHPLLSSQVFLFKAINRGASLGKDINGRRLMEHVLNLKTNNVDRLTKHLKIIELNCDHDDILETSSEIISDYLLKSSFFDKLNNSIE